MGPGREKPLGIRLFIMIIETVHQRLVRTLSGGGGYSLRRVHLPRKSFSTKHPQLLKSEKLGVLFGGKLF